MTRDEARRRLEASTSFEVRAGLVWLRVLRGWRAVAPAPDAHAGARTGDAAGPAGAARRSEVALGTDVT